MDTTSNSNEQQQQPEAGDRRVYTSMAHVFEIDTVTKRSWSPKSDEAVPVSLVMDLRQKVLSLIGTDPKQQETIIDSVILPKTVFTRTSQKFGQWSDSVANTVYGLGFATENELNKFVTKFAEFKKLLPTTVMPSSSSSLNYNSSHQQQQQPHLGSSTSSSSWANNNTNNNSAQQQQHQQHVYNANQSSSDLNQVCNDLASAQLGSHNNTNTQTIQSQCLANNNDLHMTANIGQINNNNNNIALDSNGNNGSMISDTGADGNEIAINSSVGSHHRSHSMSGIRARMNSGSPTKSEYHLQQHEQLHSNTLGHSVKHQSSSHSTGGSVTKSTNNNNNHSPLSTRESQLKYENDRLKLALADINIEYNANKKKWQLEVQKLKTNIYKLTGALQESNNNRHEWEQLLSKLRSENTKYQMRILENLAANGDPEARTSFQEKFDRLNQELEKSQNELKNKEYEISVLREDLEELRKEKNSHKVNFHCENIYIYILLYFI